MIKYESISAYWVIDEIRQGKKVYVCDRKLRSVHLVNTTPVEDVIKVTEGEEKGRYDFWTEEEIPDEVTEEKESENE